MTSDQIEQFNELAQVAMDAEVRFRLLGASLKAGNVVLSKMHIEQAKNVCQRIQNELTIMED